MNQQLGLLQPADMAGVIWITGYSAAGKTTIGRKVEARLRETGLSTVFLDGDDLRSIFGSHWGYEREQRIDLARVYFRLCSHLASQGHIVVIAAVAMYQDIFQWVRTNIPRNLQVYLKVPEEERRRRDRETKKVYSDKTDFGAMYDEPGAADLVIENFGGASPAEQAERIIAHYRDLDVVARDMGRQAHWRSYYSRAQAPAEPSPFASHVAGTLEPEAGLLEIGCGNGRDAAFFARQGHRVTALDLSPAAIERCRSDHADLGIQFVAGRIDEKLPELAGPFDAAYSRFVLHAMPLQEEVATLRAASSLLRPAGQFFIECRSINDPLARKGEVISPTERIHGHYRRFLIREELERRLKAAGFDIAESVESNGLAVHGDEDPVVIRITARKPG